LLVLPPTRIRPDLTHRLADIVLLLLMGATAFTLGCQELFDGDVWWHLRTGQWILDHREAPTLDPFTFTSAGRPWIDLHWLFQVILAAAYAAGGVRGMILMAAAAGTATLLVALAARDRRWPTWVVTACWLPALMAMSARLVPRPEVLSFLAMAAYLSVLFRTDDHPALAWALPAVQVLWVNSHALFVLGPIILCAYLIGQLANALAGKAWALEATPRPRGWRWWAHVGGATAAVGLACLANPYGLHGVLFPLELLPKITQWGGPYKALIIEFVDLREYVRRYGLAASGSLYTRMTCALLLAIPLSFIVPATWRAARAERDESSPTRVIAWICGLGMGVTLISAFVLALPGHGSPRGLFPPGILAPAGMAALGIVGLTLLVRTSRLAALLAVVGGLAEAAWSVWLRNHLMGPEPIPFAWPPGVDSRTLSGAVVLLGGVAAILILRAGGRGTMFRMLLAMAFGVLALQAVRNIGLFGVAAGFVLARNLGEWTSELAIEIPSARLRTASGLAARVVMSGLIGLVLISVVNGGFFRVTAESRHFGLRETPLAYAHEAAQFAGRTGLPDRALVYDLRQAGVYLFHNGPTRKLFMDGRLEVPARSTFDAYVRLDQLLIQGRPGWADPVHQMGDPLILLDHQEHFAAEATLLTDPEWRCVYHYAVASVFVSRHLRGLDASFPSVDFAARHFDFRERASRAGSSVPGSLGEAKALYSAGWALPHGQASVWPTRLAFMLLAGDRLREAIDAGAAVGGEWLLLGSACWSMVPDLTARTSGPEETWDPAIGLLPAQATYCYRRALEQYPGDTQALSTLLRSFEARRMIDAGQSTAALLGRAQADSRVAGFETVDVGSRDSTAVEIGAIAARDEGPPPGWDREGRDGLTRLVAGLLRRGRPEAAVQLFAEAERRGISPRWETSDQVAVALLHLGRPAEASRTWERASDPASPAIKLTRLATAALAALEFATAERTYQDATKLDSGRGEAWFGLALLYTQRGDAAEALAAAREGLRQSLTPAQASFLRGIETLTARHESRKGSNL
jgi:pentatricopeptide repeat protein